MTTSNQTNTRLTQKDLLGESFYSLISGSWKIKKDLSKASGIIFDYLFEYFCRIHKDKSFFSTDKIMTETGYSFNTVKNSIKELAEKNIFIIREYRANDFVILVNKISNQKFISKYDSGELIINNASFFSEKTDKKISNFIQKSVKNFQNIGKIFQKSDKNSQTFDEKNQSIVNSNLDVSIDNKEFQSLKKQSLDLNIIDHIYIDHHHIDQEASNQNLKTSTENLSQSLPKNDDDFLKNFESKEEEKSSNEIEFLKDELPAYELEEKLDTGVDYSEPKDSLTKIDKSVGTGEKRNIPPVRPADCGQTVDSFIINAPKEIKDLYKKEKFDKKTYDLLLLFFTAVNADNKNINIDLETALDLIETRSENIIKSQIEYLKVRTDNKGNAVGAGYLVKLIKANSLDIPQSYTQKIKELQQQKEIELFTTIGKIWGYTGRLGNINSAFIEVSRLVKNLFDKNKLDEIKEKIHETSKLINPYEVIKKDYLELAGAI